MIVDVKYENNKNAMALSLANILLTAEEKPVFLCVGTDKVVGDSVGAITGELLKARYKINAYIYGDLEYNINANNLKDVVKNIKINHPQSPIILIDGILGDVDEVGHVKFYPYGAYASGQFKEGVFVGDFSILAVVNTKGIDSLNFLQSVRLKTVVKQAEFIADSISRAYKYTQKLLFEF